VVLHFVEAAAGGGLAHPVRAARGFDRGARRRQVLDDEAEVMQADEGSAARAGVFFLPIVQEGDVHHPVGQVHAVGAFPIRRADPPQPECAHIELGRALGIGDGDGDMPQLGHADS
jgi:hypothetical protein